MPAFDLIIRDAGRRHPLALIEVGTSAGLNLLWDHFAYDYGPYGLAGDLASPLTLTCEVRGEVPPPLPAVMPQVTSRVGIDLHPIDVRDPEQTRWLRALRLHQAMEIARQEPPKLIAGSALDLLPELLDGAPCTATVCVFHSYLLNQFSPDARLALSHLLASHSARRSIYRVALEWIGGTLPTLHFAVYRNGVKHIILLGHCEQHGRWIEFGAQVPRA